MLATTVEPLLIPLPEAVVCIFNQLKSSRRLFANYNNLREDEVLRS